MNLHTKMTQHTNSYSSIDLRSTENKRNPHAATVERKNEGNSSMKILDEENSKQAQVVFSSAIT